MSVTSSSVVVAVGVAAGVASLDIHGGGVLAGGGQGVHVLHGLVVHSMGVISVGVRSVGSRSIAGVAQHVAGVGHVVLGPLQRVLDVHAGGGRGAGGVLVHGGDQGRVHAASGAAVVVGGVVVQATWKENLYLPSFQQNYNQPKKVKTVIQKISAYQNKFVKKMEQS